MLRRIKGAKSIKMVKQEAKQIEDIQNKQKEKPGSRALQI